MAELLTHVVQKGFDDDGTKRLAGECVNATAWRLTEQLVRLRYIVPLPEGLEPVSDAEGRFWDSLNTLKRYGRPEIEVQAESVGEKLTPTHRGGKYWDMPDGSRFEGKKVDAIAEWERRSAAVAA